MNPLLLPLEVHGPHGFDGGFSVVPLFGGFFFLLVLLTTLAACYLWSQGKLPLPAFAARRSPEDEAKRILADRFARGDISSDEFLERSSILNWTPGNDAIPARRHRRRR